MNARFKGFLAGSLVGFAGATATIALASQATLDKNGCSAGANGPLFYAGGPAVGWHSHSYAASPAGCHLYVEGNAFSNPVNYANYYLPVDAAHKGVYRYTKEFVPCDVHSSAVTYRWTIFPKGTEYPSNSLSLKAGSTCDGWFPLGTWRFYEDQDLMYGGYIRQVDNTGISGSWISIDTVYYVP
jgi:hypothetical protein